MRRPARVKPFFLVVRFVQPTADQREAQLAFSLSFLERFLVRPSIFADRRPAGGAQRCHPEFSNRRLALLPSALLVELFAPVPAGCSQLETGAAVSEPNWISLSSATSFLARAAVSRTRRFASNPVKPLSSLPPVDSDFAMARRPHRLPTADAAGCRAFAQRPQPLSSSRVCRHVQPGADPIVSDRYQVLDG